MSRVSPIGRNNHSCGYCHSTEDTSYTYGMWAHSLTCEDYQSLIDRGWRRSGSYCYKPDLSKSCCPQYTIRLNAKEFKPTKSQRKVINKFNRYIEGSWKPNKDEEMDQDGKPQQSKVNYDTKKSLIENIHHVEQGHGDYEHKFEVVLEPSSMTKEKFEVYRKYQVHIHNDEYADVSERSFKRFLIDTPLVREKFPNNKNGYGSFHQKYILDDKLIAVAVLDILPKCVSSVYFMYDPEYAFLGLGKYSALREISLTQEFSQSVSDELHWYYMGFYIHSCPKMNYKGSYQPSDLLDAETYRWYPIDECKKLLDKKEFTVFSDPQKEWNEEDRIPGTLDPSKVKASDTEKTYMLIDSEKAYPVTALVSWYESPDFREAILEYIATVGPKLAEQMMLD